MTRQIYSIILLVFLSFCNTITEQAGSPEDLGTEDIKKITQSSTLSLKQFLDKRKKNVYIEFSGIQNLSSEHINTELLTADMKARMVELQIQLVDESQRKKAMEEIRLAQEGAVVERSALEAGKFISPSYIMKGEINDNVRYISGDKEQLLIFTFQLLELETGTIKWQNRYEHKRYIPKKNFGL